MLEACGKPEGAFEPGDEGGGGFIIFLSFSSVLGISERGFIHLLKFGYCQPVHEISDSRYPNTASGIKIYIKTQPAMEKINETDVQF